MIPPPGVHGPKIAKFNRVNDDVLLSTDVFERFISACLEYYGLDPCHYFSSSRLSWNVTLK